VTAFFLGQILPYILAAVAVLGGLWGYGKQQKRKGARELQDKLKSADQKEAARIQDMLNEDRDHKSAVERLRTTGRLRDGD